MRAERRLAPERTAPRAGPAPDVAFRAFPGTQGLKRIRAEWNEVGGGLGRRRFSQLLAWHEAYAHELAAEPEALRYFVAYADAAPVAVFPLVSGVQRLGGIAARTLGLPPHDHLVLPDLVFGKSDRTAGLVAAFMRHLRSDASETWDALVLRDVLEDSAAWFSISAEPPPRLIAEPAGRCDFLECVPWEERLRRISRNFRGALRGPRNRLAQEPDVRFVRARRDDEVQAALDEFLTVEASGWKGAQGSAIRCDARLTAFYRSVAKRFAALGCAEINLLRTGGTCIAAQFCLSLDRCLYVLKIGYDEQRARLAPGNMLLEHVLKRSASEGEVDSVNLVSDAAWHASWNPQSARCFSAFLFNDTPRGRACYWSLRAKDRLRPLVRRVRSALGRGRARAG